MTGLAAGTNDYDAVNVAQLKASMTTLSSAAGTVKITTQYNDDGSWTFDLSASGGSGSGSGGHFVSVTKNNASDSDDSLKSAGNYKNDGAAGTQSTAVGVNAQAQTQGTALGNGANASNMGATAIGTGSVANGISSVALGQNASAQNDNAVAIGHGSGAYANSVAIGGNARSTAERSVHIGAMSDTSAATGSASVSIGADAQATASGAASFGTGAVASGTDALALGQNSSSTGNGSVAIGYETKVSNGKEHATAVGTSAEANATEGTVLGYNTKVNGDKGVALGSGAFVAVENGNKTSVALGAGSQVNNGDTVGTASMAIKDTYGETSDSTTYNFAGTNPTGTISVGSGSGSSEQTRTITHVAAGRVSSTSTDAINGSQLYGVTQSIEKVEQNVAKTATRYYSVNATDTGTGSNYLNDGAHGLNSIAAGNIGVVSDGKDTLKVQLADTLTGLKKIGFADSTVSIGQNGINAGGKAIGGVLAGTEETDAVNVKQLKEAKAAASAEVQAGSNVKVTSETSTKDGHTIYTVAADFKGADVNGSNAVVYDGTDKSTVTLKGTQGTKLTGLQDAALTSISTDAVTGRQLYALQQASQTPLTFQSDTGTALSVNHGDTVQFKGDGNLHTTVLTKNTIGAKEMKVSLDQDVYGSSFHLNTDPAGRDSTNDSASLANSPDLKRGVLTLRGKLSTEEGTLRTEGEFYILGNDDAAAFLPDIYQSSNTEIINPVRLGYKDQYSHVHQVATLEDGFLFTGDNSAQPLSQKLNSSVSIVGGAKNVSDDALTDGNLAVIGKQNSYTDNGQTFEAGELRIKMAKDLKGLTSGEFTDATGNKLTLQGDAVTLDRVNKDEGALAVSLTGRGLDNGNNKITGVKAGTEATDAVNFGQISSIVNKDDTIKGLRVAGDSGNHEFHLGDQMTLKGGDEAGVQNITTAMDNQGTLKVNLNRSVDLDKVEITSPQQDGSRQVMARLGTHTDEFESGSQQQVGVLELMGQNHAGKTIETRIMAAAGSPTLEEHNEYSTRIFYTNENTGAKRQVDTLEDGLKFAGDDYVKASGSTPEQNVVNTQLDQTLHITGGQTDTQQLTDLTDKNIGVVAENGGLSVRLSKVLDGMTDIYMGNNRENASHLTKNGLYLSPKSSTEYLAKFTADDGISAGSQTINDVADGVKDSDAATYGQLKKIEAKASVATRLTVNHGQTEGNLILTDTPDKDGIHHTYDVALSDKVIVGSTGNSITLDGTTNTINGGSYVKFGGQTSSTGGTSILPLTIGWQSAGLQDVLTEEEKGSQTGNYLTGLSNTSWNPMNVGYSPSRAATEGQLRDLEKQVWENPITFLGNHDADKTAEESKGIMAELGSKVRIIGTGTDEDGEFDASNINVIAGKTPDGKSDALIIQMKKAPSFTTVHAGTPDAQGVYPISVGQVTVTRDGKTETVDGVVITDGPMITKDGINNYGKQITHMKSGGIYNEADKKYHYESDEVGTNAATIQDVKNIANAAAQSEVEAKRVTVSGVNDNITVTPAADNPNHYQVKLSDTLKLGQDSKNNVNIIIDGQNGKVTVGSGSTGNNSVVIDGNGGTVTIGNGISGHQKVTINGNDGTLSGLTNRTIDAPDFATKGRAATEEQLKQVADNVSDLKKNNSDFQLVGEKDKEGNYTGDYKVSDDNKVKLHVQDKMHPDQVNNVVDALNKLNEKVKDAANGNWESQIDGKTVKKIKAGDVQNFTSGDNIELSNDNGAIKISTKKDVSFDKVTIGSGDSKMTLDKDGIQTGKVKVSSSEINAGGNQIHGVADGKEKDDAATVGQVAKVADAAGEAINSLGHHLSRLDTRINRVGAGAAALAALHPDPNGDDSWSISAGIGNYRNSTAAAIGAFYRPNDNMIVSMGATVGNGENMINAGVTVGIGSGVSRGPVSKAALVREISTLKQENQAKDQDKLNRIMEKLGLK